MNVTWERFSTALLILNFAFFISSVSQAQAQEFVCCAVQNDGTTAAINFYDDQEACTDECDGECIAGTECPQESVAPPTAGGAGQDQAPATRVELPNPLRETDVAVIIGRIVRMLTGGAGMIAFLMFIYGGFQWLTAAGNPEKIKKGRDILVWSILGLVVMFSAYIITRYIIDAITRGAGVV